MQLFGGEERLARIRARLAALRAAGLDLFIVSIGFRTAIIPLLAEVDVGAFFPADRVYGQDSPELEAVNHSKGKLIAELRRLHGWAKHEVMFIDDSKTHIASARRVCDTLHVDGDEGVTEDMFAEIATWAERLQSGSLGQAKK